MTVLLLKPVLDFVTFRQLPYRPASLPCIRSLRDLELYLFKANWRVLLRVSDLREQVTVRTLVRCFDQKLWVIGFRVFLEAKVLLVGILTRRNQILDGVCPFETLCVGKQQWIEFCFVHGHV